MLVVAFSGGKDSTAMALRMAELGERFVLLFTATGNELPELAAHMDRVVAATGAELVTPPGPSLRQLIDKMNALPSFRMRWCTRMIKIQPCIAWLTQHPGSTLCVGLRADEETRLGLYGDYATYRYPLREWGWREADVRGYCEQRGFTPPTRTDCAVCPYQRLGDWFRLWRDHPAEWAQGVAWEKQTGHTFRSEQRDSWPAALDELGVEFAAGKRPKSESGQQSFCFSGEVCRVCRM